jgi:hypothetical protein
MLPASTAGTIHHEAHSTSLLSVVAISGVASGCENMTTPQKGAVTGAALGSGIGMVAGGSFGQVVGAGLIGGAVGYLGGSAIESK